MARFKSLFIITWITLLNVGALRSGLKIYNDPNNIVWYWVLLSSMAPLFYFTWAFSVNVTHTQIATKTIFALVLASLLGAALSPFPTPEPLFWIISSGVIGTALYQWWFSRLDDRSSAQLKVGQILPALDLINYDGTRFKVYELNKPMLIVFYRGNWCPLCMAQIKSVAEQYRELAEKGVQTMLISPQSQSHTALLAQGFDPTLKFLVDRDNAMVKRLGIVAWNGLPAAAKALGYGRDTVMPTVILTDAAGKILFSDITDKYRVRPDPEKFLAVFNNAGV